MRMPPSLHLSLHDIQFNTEQSKENKEKVKSGFLNITRIKNLANYLIH